jgi:folate-binding Fe-S cluster repair protein YgfZ
VGRWRLDLLIDCERAQREALARRLTLYRLRRKIEIAADPSLGMHWSIDGEEGVPDPRLPALGRRWLAPGEATPGAGCMVRASSCAWRDRRGCRDQDQDRTLWLERMRPSSTA